MATGTPGEVTFVGLAALQASAQATQSSRQRDAPMLGLACGSELYEVRRYDSRRELTKSSSLFLSFLR